MINSTLRLLALPLAVQSKLRLVFRLVEIFKITVYEQNKIILIIFYSCFFISDN
jgi:hypothetical protein